jgi:hypothetical protein
VLQRALQITVIPDFYSQQISNNNGLASDLATVDADRRSSLLHGESYGGTTNETSTGSGDGDDVGLLR